MGKLHLDVVFGKPDNFRREKLEFEVVDWPSQYHAILGRPAYGRFLMVPHYAYLKMKILGKDGRVITVHGDFARADKCDRDFHKIGEVRSFKQQGGESLKDVWYRINDAHHRWIGRAHV